MFGRTLRRWTPVVVALVVAGGLTAVTAPASAAPATPAAPAAAPAVAAVRLPQLTVDPTAAKRTAAGGTGVLRFPIRLLRSASTVVTVRYATSDGTAKAGTDYTATSGTATIPAGETITTATVRVVATTVTADRTMTLTLTTPSGARLENDVATGTLLADGATTPQLNVGDAADYRRVAATGTVTFPLLLSAASTSAVSVHCATVAGTAVPGADYTNVNTTVTIPAGTTRSTVPVTLPAKWVRTGSNFTVRCDGASGATLGRATATGSILPGVEPDIAVGAVSTAFVSSTADQTVQVPIRMTRPLNVPVVFFVRSYDGTAQSDVDFARVDGSYVTIAPSSTSTTVPVHLYGTTQTTGAVSFEIAILNVTVGSDNIRRGTDGVAVIHPRAVVTIEHDPAVAQHWVQQPPDRSVEIGDTYADAASLDFPAQPDDRVQFTYATADGTAVAGRDYTAKSGTLTVGDGPIPFITVLPGSRPLGALTFTVRVTPVAPAVLMPGQDGVVTVRVDPIDTFRPTGTVRESNGKPLPSGLRVVLNTFPNNAIPVQLDANGNFALAGFPPPFATGYVTVPPGWTGDQSFSIRTAAGPGHVDLTVTSST